MATPYDDVINGFLSKITDYDLPKFLVVEREEIIIGFMKTACSKFKRLCKIDLSDRNDETKQFNQTLDDEIVDIINELMITEWLKPKLYSTENLKNILNTKDFSQYSPANLLDKIQSVFSESKSQSKRAMNNYSHIHGGVSELTL